MVPLLVIVTFVAAPERMQFQRHTIDTFPRGYQVAIEPWHGNVVAVYTGSGSWERHMLDDTLTEGHALALADFDKDGTDEIVAGWRGGGGGLRLYNATDATGSSWKRVDLDEKIAVEGAVIADMNRDGRLDIVAIAGRSNLLVWYENRGVQKALNRPNRRGASPR